MLDDLKLIHERDAQDALGIAEKEPSQLATPAMLARSLLPSRFLNVAYAGMGGSALAARLIPTWPQLGTPFELTNGYDIPKYVDSNTLFIAASYSGNTEETLSALAAAESTGATIAVIAGGGKLKTIADEKGYLLAQLPSVSQPRYAVFANFRALLQILAAAGLTEEDYDAKLGAASVMLEAAVQDWLPAVPTARNPAKQLALELIGKSVVVYGGPHMAPAAYKWKIGINENAKQIAWTDAFPEFNHNEFIGWSKQPVDKPYAVVELRSSLEHPRVQKRFEVTGRLLSGLWPQPHIVDAQGANVLEQLLWAILFGDFVSIYVALLNGLNPSPVDLIEKFKAAMNQ